MSVLCWVMLCYRMKAYSLVELVVVLTILSMVSMMTLPNYQQWIKRFRYWDVMQEVHPIKLQVEWCYWQSGSLEACSAPAYSLDYTPDASSLIDSVDVEEGVMHVVPKNNKGLQEDDDLWMHPHIRQNRVIWEFSGGAVRRGYVRS